MPASTINTVATPLVAAEDVTMPARLRVRGHGHNQVHLCFVYDGAFEERTPRGSTLMSSGMLRASPAGDVHELRFSTAGSGCLLLLIEHELADDIRLPGERRFYEPVAMSDLIAPLRDSIAGGSALNAELITLELLARLSHEPIRTQRARPAWLMRVRDTLHAAAPHPPSTRALADAAGFHPVYVARAFRHWFGCSLAEYSRRLRLEYARQRLLEPGLPIAQVAIAAGYADQSHLHREVRRRIGSTPAAVRRAEVSRVQDAAPAID
ncbi:MAG: AraC family transcriptional regulator [Gemmatimonadota bacterium]